MKIHRDPSSISPIDIDPLTLNFFYLPLGISPYSSPGLDLKTLAVPTH